MISMRQGWRITGVAISAVVMLGLLAGPLPEEKWHGGVGLEESGHAQTEAGSGAVEQSSMERCDDWSRVSWQNEFAQITMQLDTEHPGQLAHAAIVDDGCAALLMFRGAVPEQARTLTATLPVPVRLVGDRGYSQDELVDVLHSVYHPIVDHPQVVTASGTPATEHGIVVIHAQPDGPTTRSERDALCDQLRPADPANSAIRIQLILAESLHHPATRLHPC
jgi:hypothetical protein